jgi:hypothetical protein
VIALLPGVADGIEQNTRQRTNQADLRVLGAVSNRNKYAKATQKGSEAKDQDPGIEAGIAKKLGNADGVKASTRWNCG